MNDNFFTWIKENEGYLEPLNEVVQRLNKKANVLCIGQYSILGGALIKDIVGANVDILLDEDSNIDPTMLEQLNLNRVSSIKDSYTFVFMPIYINTINKDLVVPLLFDIYEKLKKQSEFLIYFLSSARVEPKPLELMPAFYNEEEKMLVKLYTAEDVINTLSTLGFKFSKIDYLAVNSPYRIVYVDCLKIIP